MVTFSATNVLISILIAGGVLVFFSGVKDRLKDTHDAHQLVIGMIGLFRAFARHGVLNSLRAVELLDRSEEKLQYNLEKQKFYIENLEQKMNDIMRLLSPDAYYKVSHFFYLVRNFNSDIAAFSGGKGIEKKHIILILERNVRLVILATYISGYFEKWDDEKESWKLDERGRKGVGLATAMVYNFFCGIVNRIGIVLYIVSNFKQDMLVKRLI